MRGKKKPIKLDFYYIINSDTAFYHEIIFEEIIQVLVANTVEEWLIMANILF